MSATEDGERRGSGLKASLLERLHEPFPLRICVIAVVLLAGYFGVYGPLSNQIAESTRQLKQDTKLLELAGCVEKLRGQHEVFADRVPKQSDSKEWVQYVLDGMRRFPLKLSKLDCREPKQIGPYRGIVLQIELEGSFFDVDKFLRWLESNQRLIRADAIRIVPGRIGQNTVVAQFTVLGLTG